MNKKQIQIGFRELTAATPGRVEISVPAGTSRADLSKFIAQIGPNLEKLRPRGCQACLSGFDIHIRERFEDILTFEA